MEPTHLIMRVRVSDIRQTTINLETGIKDS